MRRLVLVMAAGCSGSSMSSGNGEIVISESSPLRPADSTGHASADFVGGSLDRRICSAVTTIGACVVRANCMADDTPRSYSSAGEITIDPWTAPYPLTPDATGSYGSIGVADGHFTAPNTVLALHAAGDQISPFDLTLTSPGALTVLSPANSDVLRSADLAVAWSGVTMGSVFVTVGDGLAHPSSIECDFSGGDGAGAIPAAALTLYGKDSGYIAIVSKTTASTTVDAWDVTFQVSYDAEWPESTSAQHLTFHD